MRSASRAAVHSQKGRSRVRGRRRTNASRRPRYGLVALGGLPERGASESPGNSIRLIARKPAPHRLSVLADDRGHLGTPALPSLEAPSVRLDRPTRLVPTTLRDQTDRLIDIEKAPVAGTELDGHIAIRQAHAPPRRSSVREPRKLLRVGPRERHG
jgi:hypothetical protein